MDSHQIEAIVSRTSGRRFLMLILGSIVIAIVLVMMSMALYVSSGASQLDLSRPGYESIREQVTGNESFKGFDASGEINEESLDEFDKLYMKKLKEAQSVDAFGGDVLSPKSLQIDQETASQ